jgi:hypothetical protein
MARSWDLRDFISDVYVDVHEAPGKDAIHSCLLKTNTSCGSYL